MCYCTYLYKNKYSTGTFTTIVHVQVLVLIVQKYTCILSVCHPHKKYLCSKSARRHDDEKGVANSVRLYVPVPALVLFQRFHHTGNSCTCTVQIEIILLPSGYGSTSNWNWWQLLFYNISWKLLTTMPSVFMFCGPNPFRQMTNTAEHSASSEFGKALA